jgi:hypothetical protein
MRRKHVDDYAARDKPLPSTTTASSCSKRLRHLEAGLRFTGIDVLMSSVKRNLSIVLCTGPSGMPDTPTMLEEK